MNARRGVTLIELLVVIALLSIPVGIALEIYRQSNYQLHLRSSESEKMDSLFLERSKDRGSVRIRYENAQVIK